MAAGLEDDLIRQIQPEWNQAGVKQIEKDHDIDKESLIDADIENSDTKQGSTVLQETYYKMGFFNLPVELDSYVGSDRQNIDIYLSEKKSIRGYINRKANTNKTARIMGGKEVRDWFQNNVKPMDKLSIEFLSPTTIRLKKQC